MNLTDLGEFGLIDRIRRSYSLTTARTPVGIGDDAAALSLSPSRMLLATTDLLIEGVHFDLATTDLCSLGWKAAAVNLSDIAAMGGNPRYCLVGLGLPGRMKVEQVQELYRGIHALAGKHRTLLVGGDTCRSGQGLLISVVLLGEIQRRLLITRSGARPGDLLFVTGTLGESGAGLELLQHRTGRKAAGEHRAAERSLIERHLRPVPRVNWGRRLAASGCVTAMIDVSDGLSSDLGHLCEQSGVGAEVHADRLPRSPALTRARGLRRPALDYVLSGGEDYELLFTVPRRRVRALRDLRIPVTEIGRMTTAKTVVLVTEDGKRKRLSASGYDHFRRRGRRSGGGR